MNLINLKMATAVAVVLTMVASLAPEAAHAQIEAPLFDAVSNLLRNGTQQSTVTFDLDNSVPDTNPSNDIGEYLGAITNFTDERRFLADGSLVESLSVTPGNLTASRLPDNPNTFTGNFDDLDIGYEDINTGDINTVGLFDNGGLRYDVTFPVSSDRLTLFIPSTDSNLINSLSNLSQFTSIPGVVTRSNGEIERFGLSGFPASRPFQPVPEPSDTAGLLAMGALGAVLLLKRKRR